MNRRECDILQTIREHGYITQRKIAEFSGYSLGVINKSIAGLIETGYLDMDGQISDKAEKLFENSKPKNAIILAAGYGMRMVPINTEIPKGLLEVHGEPLIERIIKQLHEVGIEDIQVVVGFMKEQYEYLIDQYHVKLTVNAEYSHKNNLYSLNRVLKHLGNTYVVPCDIWCKENPFSKSELYSWYMISDALNKESSVRINRKMELIRVPKETDGNAMIGISYLASESEMIKENIRKMCSTEKFDDSFWEEALYNENKMIIYGKMVSSEKFVEINTYEQLRDLDSSSNQLKSNTISIAAKALHVREQEIKNITVLKKGMTNRSFLFECGEKKYIMRIPGEGTDQLINRQQEAAVYKEIAEKHICDDIAYINPDNGYKITEFLENARVCDPEDEEDVKKCMKRLRGFHELRLKVDHEFDIFGQIEFYENLWNGISSAYRDYSKTKEDVISLKELIERYTGEKVLTHIDAVPDNFLFVEQNGKEEIRLIDWEYAGMQDPHVDIAMFCIYALYDKDQVDQVINAYFTEGCDRGTRIKIYCYIAACGLLWSNWCEYKRTLGVEFGEYSLRQYRYAKDYYKIVQEELENAESEEISCV